MPGRSVATIIVGACALRREGLASILAAANFRIVASALCVDDLVLRVRSQRRSSLLIIDAEDDLDVTVRQIERFKQRHPSARIAVVADHDQPSDIASVFRAGANGYFIRIEPCDAFIKSLELVMMGETVLPTAILPSIFDHADDDECDSNERAFAHDMKTAGEALEAERSDIPRLSVREKSILNCLIEGHSNKVIARKVGASEATVKVHVKAILRKVRLRNRTQAAVWAISNGFSATDDGSSAPTRTVLPVTQVNGPALLPAVVQRTERTSYDDLPSGVVQFGINRRSA
jgi:DNA-binding NarL/FixJ family response regulator